MKNFFKSAAFKILVAVALFLVGIMAYAASTGGAATIPATIAGSILTPLQSLGSAISGGLSGALGMLTDSAALRKENAALQSEVNELRQDQVELDELRRENELFRQFLELKEENSDYQFVYARVMVLDPSDRYSNFTLNKGSTAGVKVNDPVLTPDGLVGKVYETGLTYAKVRTLLDPATQVGATVLRKNAGGISGGSLSLAQQGLFRLNYLSRESGVASGDRIVTSGKGGVYPPNLLIGTVQEVASDTDGVSMFATVKPYADIHNVSEVLVLTSFEGQGEDAG